MVQVLLQHGTTNRVPGTSTPAIKSRFKFQAFNLSGQLLEYPQLNRRHSIKRQATLMKLSGPTTMRFVLACLFVSLQFGDSFMQPKPSFQRPQLQRQILDTHFLFSSYPVSGINPSVALHAVSNNAELQAGIAAIDAANPGLYQTLSKLRENPYFKLYSVDILASCEYIPQELFECYSETCEIYPVDEEEIPQKLKAVDASEHEFELDGWARWDMPTDDYYDISAFPEGYTGYDGREVWDFIHKKICFAGYNYDDDNWKADFNKAVSGLHTMISAQVNRGIQERVDSGESFTDDEKWRDPDAEFSRRLSPRGETPLALENLYFGYMLLVKAVAMAKPLLQRDCESGKIDGDACGELQALLNDPLLNNDEVAVASNRLKTHAMNAEGGLWEARMRTRELVRIMNCVQCNKCRLHGKISTMGLSTAFQILMEGDVYRLHRVELATLVATLHKFSTAVDFCQRKMY